ncbi:hypothetical protein F503_00665 [Ophiostoma piceae UAMH 11346]|uniref:D-lactate dehydratase n=1 Tax=Ophiostoma piceae (strain UAMH 11346) TaxID=1262450 RepID=S3BPT4_OPHP1|nr:hypothetical protein F503_00665 [Ophiostoma piceae UAMH 11346]
MPSVLVVLSSHSVLGNTGKPTGWYLPEFAHPYNEFVKAGFTVTVASPKGGATPLDPASVEAFKEDPASVEFLNTKKSVYNETIKLETIAADQATAAATATKYDALFYPGGHGPMYDLAFDKQSHYLAAAFNKAGKVVSAVCHGPAAIVNVRENPDDESSAFILKGKTVNSFTDDEERAVQLEKVVPFLLETRLKEIGATFVKAGDWQEKVVVDGNIITGQNPASASGVGAAIVKAVGN